MSGLGSEGEEEVVNLKERVLAGVFGRIAATLVLSGLREAWTKFGLVFETAPMQVVERMQEVGLVEAPRTRNAPV